MTSWGLSRATRWAAPVVVTVALAPGCQSTEPPKSGCEPPECHMNPPGVEPTGEPSAATATPPEPSAATAPTSVASTAPSVNELPEAPP